VWKLAAINLGVDGPFYTDSSGNGQFLAALFDARDLYYQDQTNPPHYTLITGSDPVPTGFYSTRISSCLDWIYSVIDPTGDAGGNGIPNLLQYALDLNSPLEQGYGPTQVGLSGATLSLTYRKITTTTQLQYQVEHPLQCTDYPSQRSSGLKHFPVLASPHYPAIAGLHSPAPFVEFVTIDD
jgi:hypothetical protein